MRFATAVIATWILNLGMFGERFKVRSVCSPGFACHGCPWSTAACPIGAMAYGSAIHALPVFAIASVLAVGAAVGRLVCGFACPMGLLQDLLYRIPSPKVSLPRFCRYGKYLALALLVVALPWILQFVQSGYLAVAKPKVDKAGDEIKVNVMVSNPGTEPVKGPRVVAIYRSHEGKRETFRLEKEFPDITIAPGQKDVALPEFQIPNQLASADLEVSSPQSEVMQSSPYQLYYCRLCPTGTLTATIPSWFSAQGGKSIYARMSGAWLRLSILGLFLILMVLATRPLCRLFCPLGAIYGLTARYSLCGMSINQEQCIHCGQCNKVCPMELDVQKEIGGSECIVCGDCKKACPKQGIKRTFGLGPAAAEFVPYSGCKLTR